LLDKPDVRAALEQVRRAGVAEHVAGTAFFMPRAYNSYRPSTGMRRFGLGKHAETSRP